MIDKTQLDAYDELTPAERLDYHEHLLGILGRTGRRRLKAQKKGKRRGENLALRVITLAVKGELALSRQRLLHQA